MDDNGKKDGDNGEGNGEVAQVFSDLDTRRKRRETMQFLKKAARYGWNVTDQMYQECPKILFTIACDEGADVRSRALAMSTLRAMAKDRVDAAIALDKIERLDAGEATERTELGPIRLDGGREL